MIKQWILFIALCGWALATSAQPTPTAAGAPADAPPAPGNTQSAMSATPTASTSTGSQPASSESQPMLPPPGPSIDVTNGTTWVTINCGLKASLKDCAAVASALLSQTPKSQQQSNSGQ